MSQRPYGEMSNFDYDHVQRIVVLVGIVAVGGLWFAEEAGLIHTASPGAAAGVPMSPVPGLQSSVEGVVLEGVIPGKGDAPGIAILALTGQRPVLVSEGSFFNGDIRVERVLPDRVLLRRRGDGAPLILPLTPMSGSLLPPAAGGTASGAH